MNENVQLLEIAEQLYLVGTDVDAARERLQQLVTDGVPYESKQMRTALRAYQDLKTHWDELESSYLALRKRVTR